MKKISFIMFLGLILFSCEKKGYLYISSSDKSLYDFKVGTYWNYVNVETNEIEKISVIKRDASAYYSGHTDSNDVYGEEIITQFSSSLSEVKYIQTISKGHRDHSAYIEKYVNDNLMTTDNILYAKDSAFSINIQGTEYNNVYLVNSYYNKYNANIINPVEKLYVNQYWIARNIGIIKKILQDSNGITTYELKTCKIIQ